MEPKGWWNKEVEDLRQQLAEAFQAGAASRDAEVTNLAALGSSYLNRANAAELELDQLRQQLAAMEDKYLVERGMLKLKRAELADSQRDVKMLHSYLKRWAFTASDDECAHMEVQEALAATEPKTTS